jgi:hypothetical protein
LLLAFVECVVRSTRRGSSASPAGHHGSVPGTYRPSCKPIVDLAVRRDRVIFIFDELADGVALRQPIRPGVLFCLVILH